MSPVCRPAYLQAAQPNSPVPELHHIQNNGTRFNPTHTNTEKKHKALLSFNTFTLRDICSNWNPSGSSRWANHTVSFSCIWLVEPKSTGLTQHLIWLVLKVPCFTGLTHLGLFTPEGARFTGLWGNTNKNTQK